MADDVEYVARHLTCKGIAFFYYGELENNCSLVPEKAMYLDGSEPNDTEVPRCSSCNNRISFKDLVFEVDGVVRYKMVPMAYGGYRLTNDLEDLGVYQGRFENYFTVDQLRQLQAYIGNDRVEELKKRLYKQLHRSQYFTEIWIDDYFDSMGGVNEVIVGKTKEESREKTEEKIKMLREEIKKEYKPYYKMLEDRTKKKPK